jgi:hypothetical protein
MESNWNQRLLDFLNSALNPDGDICLLAVSAIELQQDRQETVQLKVRVALTVRDGEAINPYFDGTDLFVAMNPSEARFIHEDSWAEGPPIMEGSPIELALGWVSELAPPFFVSPKAREAARMGMAEKEGKEQPENGIDFDSYF